MPTDGPFARRNLLALCVLDVQPTRDVDTSSCRQSAARQVLPGWLAAEKTAAFGSAFEVRSRRHKPPVLRADRDNFRTIVGTVGKRLSRDLVYT